MRGLIVKLMKTAECNDVCEIHKLLGMLQYNLVKWAGQVGHMISVGGPFQQDISWFP